MAKKATWLSSMQNQINSAVQDALKALGGITFTIAEFEMLQSDIALSSDDQIEFEKLVETRNLEDVQNVFHNVDL